NVVIGDDIVLNNIVVEPVVEIDAGMGGVGRAILNRESVQGDAAGVEFDGRFCAVAVDNGLRPAHRAAVAGGTGIETGVRAVDGQRHGDVDEFVISAGRDIERAAREGGIDASLHRAKGIQADNMRAGTGIAVVWVGDVSAIGQTGVAGVHIRHGRL